MTTVTSILHWKALKMQIETAREDQVAWVGVQKYTVEQFKAGNKIKGWVSILNCGKTPACNLWTITSIGVGPRNLNVDVYAKQRRKDHPVPPPGKVTLFPFQEPLLVASFSSYSLSEQDINNINEETQMVYLFGEIYYTDVLKKERITRFCARYEPDLGGFVQYPQYNNVE